MSANDSSDDRHPAGGNAQQSNLTKFFRARFIAVAAVIAALAVMIALSIVFSGAHESEHNRILNVLGRQRMLTQMMAKDANRISTLVDAIA